jgi:hypothetical protein
MPKQGFKRNAKAISQILHNDPRGQAAVRAAAKKIADQIPGAEVVEYDTDRFVAGVQVDADAQAKDGVATRAAGNVS